MTTNEAPVRAIAELIEADRVRKVLYDYAYYLDMNQPDDLANLFADDCYVAYGPDFGAQGRDEYRKTLDGIGTFFTATSHHVSNVVLDFSEDMSSVIVRSVLYAWHSYTKEGKSDGHFFGQYHDNLILDDDRGWIFARRELRAAKRGGLPCKEADPDRARITMAVQSPGGGEVITVEHGDAISWIVLNRPEKANSLSNQLLDDFSVALASLRDQGAPIIGIRGAGKGFSAGYDIDQVGKPKQADPVADRERLARNLNRYLAIWDHPKPVIAAVHGYCIAGATQMCVFADVTVVAEDATIGEPAIPLGGGYIAPLWAPLVGPKRAKELSFIPGNSIDGTTAVDWGWANHAVPASGLIDYVEKMAERMARTPSDVLRLKKLSINRSMEAMGVRTAAQSGAEFDALLHLSPAVAEVRKFVAEVGLKSAISHYKA